MIAAIRAGRLRRTATLENLGSLAQPYKGGNSVPSLRTRFGSHCGGDEVVAEPATFEKPKRNLLPGHCRQFWQAAVLGEMKPDIRKPRFAQDAGQISPKQRRNMSRVAAILKRHEVPAQNQRYQLLF